MGVILTGLLNDGSAGLAALAQCGGATAVQSPADAKAPDMPLEALETTDVDYRGSAAELAVVLVELTNQDIEPSFKVPADLELEVRIALGRPTDSRTTSTIGDPTTLSCPRVAECCPRCGAAHLFVSAARLVMPLLPKYWPGSRKTRLDEAIRTALRIIEKRVVLLEKMAADASQASRTYSAREYQNRAAELRGRAVTLRKAAMETEPEKSIASR